MKQGCAVHYDPRLVEEAVFHAQRDSCVQRELDEQRNRIYQVADPDERDRLFIDLNRAWFDRLGLNGAIENALREQPLIAARVHDCFIVGAAHSKDEGAELFVAHAPEQRRTLRVLLRPEAFLSPASLQTFLRHELLHIADMLDPAFAYEPALPKAPGGPTHDTLITNRYRVLWDTTINGRMLRRGWGNESLRDRQYAEFARAFPMLGEGAAKLFRSFFDLEQPTHPDLAAFAFEPRQSGVHLEPRTAPGGHCPLCKFPTHVYEPAPDHLGADILAAIKVDFPHWETSHGLCAQCADLYRAREMSMAAAKLLPGGLSCATDV
jgi:hypothetical protein